jgi:copper chaperone CopZ
MGEVSHEEWTVQGMTCGGCAATVERVVGELPGIVALSADANNDSLRLSFYPETFDRGRVRSRIEDAGFDVVGDG